MQGRSKRNPRVTPTLLGVRQIIESFNFPVKCLTYDEEGRTIERHDPLDYRVGRLNQDHLDRLATLRKCLLYWNCLGDKKSHLRWNIWDHRAIPEYQVRKWSRAHIFQMRKFKDLSKYKRELETFCNWVRTTLQHPLPRGCLEFLIDADKRNSTRVSSVFVFLRPMPRGIPLVVSRALTSPLTLVGSRRQVGQRKRLGTFPLTPEIHLRCVEVSGEFLMFWVGGKEPFAPVICPSLSLKEFRTYVDRFRFLLARDHAQNTAIDPFSPFGIYSFSTSQILVWVMRLKLPSKLSKPSNALEYCKTVETFVHQCGTQDLPNTQCIMEFLGLRHSKF